MKEQPINFEESMKKLEQIAGELEKGDLTLDESVSKFEEGMQLSKQCSLTLEEAEKKINILIQDQNGELQEQPFKPEEA